MFDLLPVPAHINDETGMFCSRGGVMAPGGQCPDGCDHAAHYANDGHPECEDTGFLATLESPHTTPRRRQQGGAR